MEEVFQGDRRHVVQLDLGAVSRFTHSVVDQRPEVAAARLHYDAVRRKRGVQASEGDVAEVAVERQEADVLAEYTTVNSVAVYAVYAVVCGFFCHSSRLLIW